MQNTAVFSTLDGFCLIQIFFVKDWSTTVDLDTWEQNRNTSELFFFFQAFAKVKKQKDMVQLEFSIKHSIVREWLKDI